MAKKKTGKKKTSAKKTGKFQLAAQLFTLRDFLTTGKDVAKTLKRVRKIGYRNVQVSAVKAPLAGPELREMLDDAGVSAVGHHTNMNQLTEETADLIDYLHAIGCRYTAVASLPAEMREAGEDYRKAARTMAKYGKILAREGITLQYHNHAFEMHKFKTKTGLQLIYDTADARALQSEIDTYWIAAGGGDPAQWILDMKGRCDQVHFKDGCMIDNAFTMCEIGHGNLNWPNILKACKKAGVKHYLVEQDRCPTTNDPFKSLDMSYKFLSKMGLK